MRKAKPKPLYKFRLHLNIKELNLNGYFLVHIWELKGQLLESTGRTKNDFHALTVQPLTPNENPSKVIHIHFWFRRLGLEYVIHELGHALMYFADRNNLKVQNSEDPYYQDEEAFMRSLGELVKQFYRKIHKLGIIEDSDFIESKEYDVR